MGSVGSLLDGFLDHRSHILREDDLWILSLSRNSENLKDRQFFDLERNGALQIQLNPGRIMIASVSTVFCSSVDECRVEGRSEGRT